jgi:hypothetical protein
MTIPALYFFDLTTKRAAVSLSYIDDKTILTYEKTPDNSLCGHILYDDGTDF